MGYVFLAVAIIAEVSGTVALKLSDGFSRWGPSTVGACGVALLELGRSAA